MGIKTMINFLKKKKWFLLIIVGVLAVGAGGYFGYIKFIDYARTQAEKERNAQILAEVQQEALKEAQAEIDKDRFADYLNNTIEEEEEQEQESGSSRALSAFTTNLNESVKKNKIDPVIGRIDELENIALAMGRRSKNNVILVS